jgi:outer membrane protein insertion porin family
MMSTTMPRRKNPARTAAIAVTAMIAGLSAAETAFAQQVANPRSGRVAATQQPVINRVVVEGNKKVEKALLEDNLQLRARTRYNQAEVDADVQRILVVYRRQGRGLAAV